MEKAMEDYRQLCLKSFSLNRSREVIFARSAVASVGYL
jgi:hypothetical protein